MAKSAYRYLLGQANSRGITCTLTEAEYDALLSAGVCDYCGADITHERGVRVDRADPQQGYTASNSVPCCQACNVRKLSMTERQWRRIMGVLVRELGQGMVWPKEQRHRVGGKRRRQAREAAAVAHMVRSLGRMGAMLRGLSWAPRSSVRDAREYQRQERLRLGVKVDTGGLRKRPGLRPSAYRKQPERPPPKPGRREAWRLVIAERAEQRRRGLDPDRA